MLTEQSRVMEVGTPDNAFQNLLARLPNAAHGVQSPNPKEGRKESEGVRVGKG